MIRWSVQKGYITIPKSSREARVVENADVFDWSLSPEDEAELVRRQQAPSFFCFAVLHRDGMADTNTVVGGWLSLYYHTA